MTMTYVEEGIGVARAAWAAGIPAVVSFTVETDGRLRSGMALGEAIEACDAATGGYPVYYMVNCAHPTHFRGRLAGSGWLERIGGIRANASKMSHDELDNAPELDEGEPGGAGAGVSRADGRAAEASGCSAAAAAPTIATSARSARPAVMSMRLSRRSGAARPEDAAATSRGWSTSPARGWPGYSGRGMAEPGEDAAGLRRPARRARRGGVLLAERGDGRDRRPRGRGRSSPTGSAPSRSRSTRLPAVFRPLQALENRALGTQYVNVLATYPEFRRRGVATRLLDEAERQGRGRGA